MKQDYEAARTTIGSKPFQTYQSRTQAYLLYPANGRSTAQHLNDYQKLAAATRGNRVRLRLLQSAYVVGMAKNDPDKAMDWARENMTDFDSKPQVKNSVINLWKQHDESSASRWIGSHPELNITVNTAIKTVTVPAVVIDQRKTTVTLPR